MNYGRLLSFPENPKLEHELGRIYQALNSRLRSENLDLSEVSRAVGQKLAWGQLVPLELLIRGQEWAQFIKINQPADQYGLYVYKSAWDSETIPAVGFYASSAQGVKEVCRMETTGDGRVLYLKGVNDTYPLLYLEKGAGSGRIIDTNVSGCYLSNDGNWQSSCHSSLKIFFGPWANTKVERIIKGLEVREFAYKASGDRHFGPTAETWQSLTGIGDGEGISPIDLASLAVRGVQCVLTRLESFERRLTAIEERLTALEARQ